MTTADDLRSQRNQQNTSIEQTTNAISQIDSRIQKAKEDKIALLLEIEQATTALQMGLIQSQLEGGTLAGCEGDIQTEQGLPNDNPNPGSSLEQYADQMAHNQLWPTPENLEVFNGFVSNLPPEQAEEYLALLEELKAMGGDAAELAGHVQGDAQHFIGTKIAGCTTRADQQSIRAKIDRGEFDFDGVTAIVDDTVAAIKSIFNEPGREAWKEQLLEWDPNSSTCGSFCPLELGYRV